MNRLIVGLSSTEKTKSKKKFDQEGNYFRANESTDETISVEIKTGFEYIEFMRNLKNISNLIIGQNQSQSFAMFDSARHTDQATFIMPSINIASSLSAQSDLFVYQ